MSESALNAIHLYYCIFNSWFGNYKLFFFVPFVIFLLAVLLYMLSSTAEDFLSASVESLVDLYKMPESLAAVTVLAFGNGAIEVFSAVSNADKSFGIGDTTIFSSLSSLLGGYFFAISVNTLLALRAAPQQQVQLSKIFFGRDMIFMTIIQSYFLIIMLFIGKIDLVIVGTLIALYVIYIFVVLLQSKQQKTKAALE